MKKMMEQEYVFEFGRKFQCPHCKENISHVKGYVGQNQEMKTPVGSKIRFMVMAFLCPSCETLINIQQVGSKQGF
jgi:hypothetical protein